MQIQLSFVLYLVLVVAVILLTLRFHKVKKETKGDIDSFWEREKEAAVAPSVDLEKLPYITIPLEKFPLGLVDDDETALIEDELVALAGKPLLNLTGKTNTELKLTYGAANIKKMQAIADDYDRLTVLLVDYGKALLENGHPAEAAAVLSFGAETESDMRSNYTLLAEALTSSGHSADIPALAARVRSLPWPWAAACAAEIERNL